MSTASKITLASTTLGAISIVFLVHYGQKAEQAVRCSLGTIRSCANNQQTMHAGVVRDMERQRIKREREADFEMQRDLEEEYRKVQLVSESSGTSEKP